MSKTARARSQIGGYFIRHALAEERKRFFKLFPAARNKAVFPDKKDKVFFILDFVFGLQRNAAAQN